MINARNSEEFEAILKAAETCQLAGEFEKAAAMLISFIEMADLSEKQVIAIWLASLAEDVRELGQVGKGTSWALESLRLRTEILGAEDPYTIGSMCILAMQFQDQGRLEEAKTYSAETLRLRQKVLGAEHPDTLSSMHNLASVLHQMGTYDEAEVLFIEVLNWAQNIHGPGDPETLGTQCYLALNYGRQGKVEEFEATFREAERNSRHLDDDVPIRRTIMSYINGLSISLDP
jgi:tetratricopeptide (TPR) repeat protein